MTDQIPAGLTRDQAQAVREWAELSLTVWAPDKPAAKAARVVLAALPSPPLPTLADMTLDEQNECTGMQADLAQGDRVVILDGTPDAAGLVQVLEKSLDVYRAYPKEVTPRPDLPRMTWPGAEKPAPALPDGWRLADHKDNGRVIVTNTTPDTAGYVYFVDHTDALSMGYDWNTCRPDELTYIDTTPDPSTLTEGSVWKNANALTRACSESGRDQIAVIDKNGDVSVWDAELRGWRTYAPGPVFAPYTIIHTGREADQ